MKKNTICLISKVVDELRPAVESRSIKQAQFVFTKFKGLTEDDLLQIANFLGLPLSLSKISVRDIKEAIYKSILKLDSK